MLQAHEATLSTVPQATADPAKQLPLQTPNRCRRQVAENIRDTPPGTDKASERRPERTGTPQTGTG